MYSDNPFGTKNPFKDFDKDFKNMEKKINRGHGIVRRFVTLIFVVVIGGVVIGGCGAIMGGCGTYSEGNRAGIVNKVSRKGVIFKSTEGELTMFGVRGIEATVFKFSVDDPTVAKQVEAALDSGKRVKLHYRQKFIKGFQNDSDYIATKVEILE
jgi:hypothetical protein